MAHTAAGDNNTTDHDYSDDESSDVDGGAGSNQATRTVSNVAFSMEVSTAINNTLTRGKFLHKDYYLSLVGDMLVPCKLLLLSCTILLYFKD